MKKENLPNKIPVFPLSNFIIFPETSVPLNIFEPRYIQMIDDSMKTHRMIGMVQPKKWYSTPTISEGSTIVVNQKKPEEPFDLTQFASNWTSIISSMITVFVLNEQIKSQ